MEINHKTYVRMHATDFLCRVIFPCERSHVKFTRVNEIEAMYHYQRPRVNVKVERGSTFTFTLDFTRACAR